MLLRLRKYLGSWSKFIQLQQGIRRRILDLHHRFFAEKIKHNIENQLNKTVENNEFLVQLGKILHIPETVYSNFEDKDATVRAADITLENKYNLLGSGDVQLVPVNWHRDFKSGFEWPAGVFYRNYIQEDINTSSDVKIPRELSRCHHLLGVGLAYKLTNEEKYARFCTAQIKDWISRNPLMFSINWGCTMDVSIRSINWLWALGLLEGSASLDGSFIKMIKSSLYQHGWFIYRNPEKREFNNHNHYLADLSGQIMLGLLFRKMKEPQRWLNHGIIELFNEIRYQILPTGMSYERSTNYNRLVLELILIPLLLLKKNGFEIPADIWHRLEMMFEFIMHSLRPDGTSPIIGDQDNGRLLPLGSEDLNDFQYLLSVGALFFRRSDFKNKSNGFNLYCSVLGGDKAIDVWNSIPDKHVNLQSKAFPDAGIYICRKNGDYLIFNVTGKGLYPEILPGGHSHSDLLSFELFTLGKAFLIDPGSYVYTADADLRLLFRSTNMHNTVTVDGQSQDLLSREKIWGYDRNAIPEVIRWESSNDYDIIAARHNGYARLRDPVIHERTIIFDKIRERWHIRDNLQGQGEHLLEWFFHFNIGINIIINGNTVETDCEDGRNIVLKFSYLGELKLRKESALVSKSYGTKENGTVLVVALKGSVPMELNLEINKKISER